MQIMVDTLVKNTLYAKKTITKKLTELSISNHFLLNEEQLIHLYKNTEWINQKSWSLRFYIEDLIPDIKEKII